MNKNLIVIVGPTGIGKTALSMALAQRLQTAVVSADSRQIYKEMRIGTAVPSPEELSLVTHYFIQNKSIHDYYNASMYEQEVLALLDKLFSHNENVILCGGSGMYVDAVCKGIDDVPTIDTTTRTLLRQKLENEGLDGLRFELKKVDPEHYAIVDLRNAKRVVKALEVYYMTGRTYTSFRTNSIKNRPFNIIYIGLDMPREELYQRINQRVLHMMEAGLESEARQLLPHRNLNALNTVGYKQLFAYFDGKMTLDEAITQIQADTRKYARKQLTWFRRYENLHWFAPDALESVTEKLKNSYGISSL